MVEVGSCIASKPLGFLGGGNGMLRSLECPLVVSLVIVSSRKGGLTGSSEILWVASRWGKV
jgi:hypothetical protein